jgi:radical SAM superfamily enzyme YgiQ (UPF0313 family)
MYDVVFVVPSQKAELFEDFHGTLLLATILKRKGLAVQIHRFYEVDTQQPFADFVHKTAEMILQKKPRIVSFYCRCDCYLANLLIAKELKQACPGLYIVFGGPQADASAEDTLKEIPWVDFCCCGEGETTVYPLFAALLNGTEYEYVPGLVYRDATNQIIQNDIPPLTADLDQLPYIDYGFIAPEAVENSLRRRSAATIEVGRGCPFNCAYCSSSLFWKRKFRLKSAHRIVDEMIQMHDRFGVRQFLFQHDLFTVNKRKVLEFTQEMERREADFSWACSCRTDTLDEETIAAMAKTGLKSVFLGIETGSDRMQKSINKNLKMDDVVRVVSALRKHNIKIRASFIYALPEETQEDLEQTLQMAYRLYQMGVSSMQMHLCVIFPGTEYYRRYADEIVQSTTQSDIVGDFGFADNQEFIREHQKLFSYCYEYPSDLRSRFTQLSNYSDHLMKIYEKLQQFVPEFYRDKPLTELALEIMGLYESCPKGKNAYDIGVDYAARYMPAEAREKAVTAFSYWSDYHNASKNPKFYVNLKTYSLDIEAILQGQPLADVDTGDRLVYFKKENGSLSVNVKAV